MNTKLKNHLLSAFFFFMLLGNLNAQVDIKFNPLGIVFFGPVNASVEFPISHKMSLDLGAGIRLNSSLIPYRNNAFSQDYKVLALWQYYPNAFQKMDRFSIGLYSKNRFGIFNVGETALPFRRLAFGFAFGLKYYDAPTRFGFGLQLGSGIAYVNNFTNVDGTKNDFKAISVESGLVDGLANFTFSYRLNPINEYNLIKADDPLNIESTETTNQDDRKKKSSNADRKKKSRSKSAKKKSKKSRKKSKGKKRPE